MFIIFNAYTIAIKNTKKIIKCYKKTYFIIMIMLHNLSI